MTGLVVLTVIDVLLLIAGLAFYLFWVGTLLTRIAGNLEECAEIVRTIVGHAKLIGPGVEHINETGGVVAGALPLLYGMAEGIVAGVTPRPEAPAVPEPARPASGTRRSRLLDAVGFAPKAYGLTGRSLRPRRVLGQAWGGRGGPADPLVLPRLVELLVVAPGLVDRGQLPGDLLPVRSARRPAPRTCRCRPSTWTRRA